MTMSLEERAQLIATTIIGDIGYAGKNPVDFVKAQLEAFLATQPRCTMSVTVGDRSLQYSAPTAEEVLTIYSAANQKQ